MSSRIIEIAGKKLAIALEWESLSSTEKERKFIRKTAKEIGTTLYARNGLKGEDGLVGFLSGPESNSAKGKIYSAALAFAGLEMIVPNAFMVWEFNDGTAWVCHVRNGSPVVDGDKIVDTDAVSTLIENQRTLDGDNSDLTIYGNSTFFGDNPLDIDDIARAAGRGDEIKKIFPIDIEPGTAILAGFLIAGAMGGYWYYQEQERIAEEQRRLAEQQKQDPNKLYAENLAIMNPGAIASARFRVLQVGLDAITPSVAGWEFVSVECLFDDAPRCNYTWKRVDGNNRDLKTALKVPAEAVWSLDGVSVEYSVPLTGEEKYPKVSVKSLPGFSNLSIDFLSRAQDAAVAFDNVKVGFAQSAPWGLPPGVTFVDVKPELLVTSGEWSFDGEYFMGMFINELPDNFSLRSIKVDRTGDNFNLAARGNYYAR